MPEGLKFYQEILEVDTVFKPVVFDTCAIPFSSCT